MTQKITPCRMIAATHNPGKVTELKALMEPFGFEVTSALALGLDVPDETEETFIGNALLKARASSRATGLLALADDSGMAVEALSGAPGIHAALWAGPERDFTLAMERVRIALEAEGSGNRAAKFICALALVWPDGRETVFQGEIEGALVFPPRGQKGFGYDPIFIAEGMGETFGEMDPEKKHAMSHRAKAFAKLKAALMDD